MTDVGECADRDVEHGARPDAIESRLRVPATELPLALASLHGELAVGARVEARFAEWERDALRDVVVGGGFDVVSCRRDGDELRLVARRAWTLPDFVAPDQRLLVVGLNPSPYAADAGVGFARPGNRFWPAALAAGIAVRDRDPWDAMRERGLGMTDLVKRTTARAGELTVDEYRAGLERVARLVAWLRPRVVCFAGLAGWRAAVDRKAVAGEQAARLGGAPVYVMPNPSGLNAHDTVATLADHLRAAAALADRG